MAETRSHRPGTKPAMWDWRASWSSRATAPPHDILENGARWKHSRLVDHYLMIDGRQDNIKFRSGSLQVKQFIEQYEGFRAYRRKQYFRFPLAARRLLIIFPRPGEPDRVFAHLALAALLGHVVAARSIVVIRKRREELSGIGASSSSAPRSRSPRGDFSRWLSRAPSWKGSREPQPTFQPTRRWSADTQSSSPNSRWSIAAPSDRLPTPRHRFTRLFLRGP
jgi:hypothetical protein